jgi:glycosyltransferase involved in cell wall biosynthesis
MGSRKILQITSYPPPRAGWGVRVQFLKRHLERQGHECVVLNIGMSRRIPSDEYEMVLGGFDYLRKVWRFSRRGYVAHVHANGTSLKGFALVIAAQLVNLVSGQRSFLTFHAGVDQIYFPRQKSGLLLPVFWLMFALPRWIICNSEAVKAKIAEYGVNPSKIVPIPAFSRQYLEAHGDALPPDVEAFYRRFEQVIFCYIKMRPMFFPEATLNGFSRLAARRADVGLLLCGTAGKNEPDVWPGVQAHLERPDLRDRVFVVDDLEHPQFLAALARASVCLRTHLSDGVCSSVLEALSLGVPVIAAENHTRPPGVITYDPLDSEALAAALDDLLSRRSEIASQLQRPEVRDTLAQEAELLTA